MRNKLVGIRLSVEEFDHLPTAATSAGSSPAALARRLIREGLGAAAGLRQEPRRESSPVAGPLSHIVAARLTQEEFAELRDRAVDAGLAVGSFVRHRLRGLPPAPRRALTRVAIVALNRVGNNLNQLTKLAHRGTLLPSELLLRVRSVYAEVRALRDALESET